MNPNSIDPNSFAGPLPLSNPPLHVFGSYAPDGSLQTPILTSPIFTDDSTLFAYDDDHDSGDPKRRRIAKACDACRRKKIRCDGKMPACSHCLNYKTECVFTHVEKKRNPPKGLKYVEGLENRLVRMESLLRLSGLLSQDDEGSTDLGLLEQRLAKQAGRKASSPMTHSEYSRRSSQHADASRTSSPQHHAFLSPTSKVTSPREAQADEKSTTKEERDVEALSDMMCSLVTNNQGETRYLGSSSGFSIFSPKGIEWVNEKTGERSFERMLETLAEDDKWYHWRPEVFDDIFQRRVYRPLPPRDECLSLLRDFFENFNMVFPLFHEPTFMHLVDKQYSNDPYNGSGWWASLNVALAIAFRIRVMTNFSPNDSDSDAWGYFKNALAVQSELTLRNQDLLSVQALLGMALFMQGTPNPQPSYFLVAAAIRLAHSIGLHKRGSSFALNPTEIEQRKRVFWIAYMVDRDCCLRSGRPPAQADDDWNVDLPSEDPEDNVGNVPLSDGNSKCNMFRLMCRFAVIQGSVYTKLYSVRASKQSDGELLNTIGELDRELEEWKEGIPLEFRPDSDITTLSNPLIIHVVVLHFAYYNCLTTIHRMSIHRGFWTSRLSDYATQGRNALPLNPRVFNSANVCVAAARESINLIKFIPPGDYACVWLILYYPVSSLVTLFAQILQNPQDPLAHSDLRQMDLVVNFLSRISLDESTGSIKRVFKCCSGFQRIAKMTLLKTEKEMSTRQKRKHDKEREKVEKHSTSARQSIDLRRPAESRFAASSTGSSSTNAHTPAMPTYDPGTYSAPQPRPQETMYSGGYGEAWRLNGGGVTSNWIPSFEQQGMNAGGMINTQNQDQDFSLFGAANLGGTMQGDNSIFGMGALPQPYIPQDLWSMPMTFEWDWADMVNFPNNMGGGGGSGQFG